MSLSKDARVKYKTLTLEERIAVLNHAKGNPKHGCRKIAEIFGVGKTQIAAVFKDETNIRARYESMGQSGYKRARDGKYEEINEAIYKWYCLARDSMVPINGPMLQEEASAIAARLGKYPDFKASSGWLECWKNRYGIKQRVVEGESGQVQTEAVESWMERLIELCKGYSPEDIWNEDETGCFFRALPEKSLAEEGRRCRGGKKSKLRMTVALFTNANGDKEEPVVIWRSLNPRCFKNLPGKRPLHVKYFSNPKSWMNSEIMKELLNKLNRKMRNQGRHIILFLDNAGCHPSDVKDSYSNIKMVFLPPNTTSRLQPLDAGIIKNFKVRYRKLLLKFVVSHVNSRSTAAEIVNTVDVLQAIRWVKQAWEEVPKEMIRKCFHKCGFSPSICESEVTEDTALFEEFGNLVQRIDGIDRLSAEQYISVDEEVPTSAPPVNTSRDDWREALRDEALFLCAAEADEPASKETVVEDSDQEEVDIEPVESSIQSIAEAMKVVADLQRFASSKLKDDDMVTGLMKISQRLQDARLATQQQCSITKFFS